MSMNNNSTDRFSRMVAQGLITKAEAKRRRAQSQLTRQAGFGPVQPAPRPRARVSNPQGVSSTQSGFRPTEVWTTWQDWPDNTQLWGHYLVPAESGAEAGGGVVPFPSVGVVDHKLVRAFVEIDCGVFDTNTYAAVVSASLVRDGGVDPTERTLSEYVGARKTDITPDKSLIRWTFEPRQGDSVDSVHVDQPLRLMLGLRETMKTVTGSNTLPPLRRPADLLRLRVGASYLVRDRQGLLM
nr:MAG: hypothetical protein [Barnaviridae sp.]